MGSKQARTVRVWNAKQAQGPVSFGPTKLRQLWRAAGRDPSSEALLPGCELRLLSWVKVT